MLQNTLRSPRQIDFDHPAMAQHEFCPAAPANGAISHQLWHACQDIAEQALATDFIQGLAAGDLAPTVYGQYTIQDCAYCFHAVEDIRTILHRAEYFHDHPKLAVFARAREQSYQTYVEDLLKQWHINDVHAIAQGEAVKGYIEFERTIAETLCPIYGIVAMLPCRQIWTWLATEMKPRIDARNIYRFWVDQNCDEEGTHRLANFIDEWFECNENEFDRATAYHTYRCAITCELNMFLSAHDMPLVPLPACPHESP